MNNNEFLTTILNSFLKYLNTGSNSNEKLKILHGDIANDIQSRIDKKYSVFSLSNFNTSERKVVGRFYEKKVDICISEDEKDLIAIGVKFVMQNYSQNSGNYFDNMLGETANIREKKIKCFQIVIIPKFVPYFTDKSKINKIEELNNNKLSKYIKLSKTGNVTRKYIPDKLLLIIVDLPINSVVLGKTKNEYKDYMLDLNEKSNLSISYSNLKLKYGKKLIFNDYEKFIDEVIKEIK